MRCFAFQISQDIEAVSLSSLTERAAAASQAIFLESKRKVFSFFSSVSNQLLRGCVLLNPAAHQGKDAEGCVLAFLSALNLTAHDLTISPASEEAALQALFTASRRALVCEIDSALDAFGALRMRNSIAEVNYIARGAAKHRLLPQAMKLDLPALDHELERIQLTNAHPVCEGHPVQYVVALEKEQGHLEAVRLLLSSLYAARRIQRGRYQTLRIPADDFEEEFSEIMDCAAGGAIVLDFISEDPASAEYARTIEYHMHAIRRKILENEHRVLSIICCLPSRLHCLKIITDAMPGTKFLILKQEIMNAASAKAYLHQLAEAQGAVADEELLVSADKGRQPMQQFALEKLFATWYSGYLRREVYPQYHHTSCASHDLQMEMSIDHQACNQKNSYDKLQQMVGLHRAKEAMDQMLAAHRAKDLFNKWGMPGGATPMHMMFTGNPGTAKTSVARLYARILQEQGVLQRGELIEVGRGDLVGRFVGSTVRLVKDWFRKAHGSILFIDEAYALATDNAGGFGQEAIDTLVMEMENNRESTLVILAGYPDKMSGLLMQNPGLRSRIGFQVAFDDYSTDELLGILQLLAKQQNILLDEGVSPLLRPWLAKAKDHSEFGNGRYVRNLLDRARMKQAERLLLMSPETLTDSVIRTLLPEDFVMPELQTKAVARIGF